MKKVLVPMAYLSLPNDPHAPLHFARATYIQKLINYDLLPVFVSSLFPKEFVNILYDECAGVLCMGGTDFDPARYGEVPDKTISAQEPLRDDLELYVIQKAIADKKPYLGICRGCQALAIASGGKLNQNVPDITNESHGVSEGGTYSELAIQEGHAVRIEEKTKAHSILNRETATINTGHHQSIKSLGDYLIVSGKTEGGIVEVIESRDPHYFCVGIQGHPEAQANGNFEPFFKAFAEAVAAYEKTS